MKPVTKQVCAHLIRGTIWNCNSSPFSDPDFEEISDGALAIDSQGRILGLGTASSLKRLFKPKNETHFKDSVLLPGFIDTHIHFPQMNQIGCHGESLLGWLEKYIYPEEIRMSHPQQAQRFSSLFFDELLQNGTTTSLILSSSDASSTDILFNSAKDSGARAIIGKVSMDRLAPKELIRSVSQDKDHSERLISKWHGKEGRLFYALTPRFSPACSNAMLRMLGELAQKYSGVRIQTHFSENLDEIKLVKKLFPKAKDYLHTYEDFGLLNERTVLAHCIHASASEINRMAKLKVNVSHCPTSNLFLGSGLFPMDAYSRKEITTSVGTDIGAGTSFSIWTTLGAAYKIQRLRHQDVSTAQLFYLATLGGAKALGLENEVGNFEVGKKADIQVINWKKKSILKARMENSQTALDRFFSCLFHFEKDLIEAVFVDGKPVFARQ
ncbi:MAG: guanine deaminase [Proteobacteria bacterium]|nr:guanine deaminase [Pseudomonadota bacterium]